MERTRSISSPSAIASSIHSFRPCLPRSSTHHSPLKHNKIFVIKSSPRSPLSSVAKEENPNSNLGTLSFLYKKNPHVLHKEIQRLARRNNLNEAVSLLDYLQQLGVPVNPTTFSAVIAACIRSKSFDQAKRVHALIRANGLGRNEFLRIKVIKMYASCGCFGKAETESFDLCSSGGSSVYQWNALLRGLVVSGNRRSEDMMFTFSTMRELGVEMNVYTYSCFIKALAGAREFGEGLKAHALLVKNGLIGSPVLQTCLMDLYFKCRKPRYARLLFDEMLERDIVAWGAMVAGLAHSGYRREAVEYLRWMVAQGISPNSVGLTTILPVIGELGARNIGKAIHAYVVKRSKYSEQVFIQSALIDMYSKCGDIKSARKTFNESKMRNHVSWTALISGYISHGRLEQALRLVIWMQQEGVSPDVVTLATVLPVCGELRAALQGRAIHGYLLRHRMLLNVSLSTSLMVMYSKCGKLDFCRRLFDRMERRNVISWTALFDSLTEHACLDEALDVFRSMLLREQKPDAVMISNVLGVCSQLQLLKLGKQIHGHALKKKFDRFAFVSAQVSNMYRNCKEIEKAELVLDHRGFEGDRFSDRFEDRSINHVQ